MDSGIDFYQTERDDMDKFKEQFKQYIVETPRNEFYQMVKGCSEDPSYIDSLIRLRFAFKYNKMIDCIISKFLNLIYFSKKI